MSAARAGPRVLLLSPGAIKRTDADFGLPHLVSLGGYLEAHLPVRAVILDLGYEGGDRRRLARCIAERGPFALVGISAYSSFDHLRVIALGALIKQLLPSVPLVAGGYHATALPRSLLSPGAPFDAVIVGEGEIPMRDAVAAVLGGGAPPRGVLGPAHVDDLDTLPPYRWDLIDHYWPRAPKLGRKVQLYLSRGCPFDCTFCMERAKADRRWRAFSPERALAELRGLARAAEAAGAPLSGFIVNVADPLFGLERAWRRAVLEGIVREGIAPRQFWTLTRADSLDQDDVRLLAAARFAIGLGLESGSPTMLSLMNKSARPERYLESVLRLARHSRDHGLNWAVNLVVGHPGENRETMEETVAFVERLFDGGRETRGWLSVDPFRLYPGSHVHEQRAEWERRFGARFHRPSWWASPHDPAFSAEFIDPSAALTFEERVRRAHASYAPLVRRIAAGFKGQGRDVDETFRRSIAEQERLLSVAERDRLLARAEAARRPSAAAGVPGSGWVRVGRHLSATLAYHVLSHLDLGRDAASLHAPGRPRRPWAAPLRAAYGAAPGRTALQFVGLYGWTVDELVARLGEGRLATLEDPAGRRLCELFAGALEFERGAVEREFALDSAAHAARARRFAPLLAPLVRCRAALWRRLGRTPPPLVVLDCPALGRHGRGMTYRPTRRGVAVSLGEPPEHVFCQILHEETHPVSDRHGRDGPARDTRVGARGFASHRRAEQRAVALGAEVVAAAAPELSEAFATWIARHR